MTWRLWCRVVVVAAAAAAATSGAAPYKKEYQCSNDRPCVSFAECLAPRERVKTVEIEICGRDKNNFPMICCPPLEETLDDSVREIHKPNPRGEELLPNSDECGLHPEKIYRIFFGMDAKVNAYPWMALLIYDTGDLPPLMCGGSLINERYVVTAAHCIRPELVKVRLGEHNIATNIDCRESSKSECSPPQDFTPEEVYRHEEYQKNGVYSDDIAIIRLNKKAKLGLSVQPLCLPPAGLDVEKFLGTRHAFVTGWGETQNGTTANILQVVDIPLANRGKCDTLYPFPLSEGQVCYGGEGRKDSCSGDSGGPVFQIDEKTNQYIMLALVSLGSVCGTPGVPAIYADAVYYREWIVGQLKP